MNEVILLISGGDRCGAESCLAREGFSVRRFSDGADAVSFASKERVDLAVLDPDPDLDTDQNFPDSGLFLLKCLREKFTFPIILLSGSDELAELIPFADDFVIKPFSMSELAARVKAQLRRNMRAVYSVSPESSEPSEIVIGGLYINNPSHKCRLDGEEIKLTPLEFDILWYLCVRRGRVVSGEELFEAVWGEKYLDSAGTVMPHIARLRGKLREPPRHPKYVRTIWGVGYTVDG